MQIKKGEKKIASELTDDVITLYQKVNCNTCRAAQVLLVERGASYETMNYHERPLSRSEIWKLLDKLNLKPRDILRKREPLYRELRLNKIHHTDAELVTIMQEHPELIERPIAVRGDKAILARPVDRILELIGKPMLKMSDRSKPKTFSPTL